jgi:hypothetical protein
VFATDAEVHPYLVGHYVCPREHKEVGLIASTPRQWVRWPMTITCSLCGEEHVLQYDDVRQDYPAFGHE